MKHFILTIATLIVFAGSIFAEDKKELNSTEGAVFTNMYFTATNGVKWPIYLKKDGTRYAVRTDKHTGKIYSYVLPTNAHFGNNKK